MLGRLSSSGYFEIVPVYLQEEGSGRTSRIDANLDDIGVLGLLFVWAYRALEARTTSVRDAFAICDATSLFNRFAKNISGDVDLVLDMTNGHGGPPPPARYGVWSLRHGDDAQGDATSASFWSVSTGKPIASAVEVSLAACEAPLVVSRTMTGTNIHSVKLTRNELCWKSSSILSRSLESCAREGPEHFFAKAVPQKETIADKHRPTIADLARHVTRMTKHRARDALARRFDLDGWILLACARDAPCTNIEDFKPIVPPPDRYWADPHVVRHSGRFYAFIEEVPFVTGKGHIAVVELSDQGLPLRSEKVLETPYHLSYPCVFEQAGEYFMLPESSANGTIDLYRCTRFPDRWEHAATLMKDVCAADPTIVHHDDRWWLFATMVENEGASLSDELFLFHSDALDGKWVPHSANPIVSDVRRARPAGAIMKRDGALYRPSQDCSVRYGYAMRLNRITKMTTSEYEETPVQTIAPTKGGLRGTHTFAYVPGLTMLDALRTRFAV